MRTVLCLSKKVSPRLTGTSATFVSTYDRQGFVAVLLPDYKKDY